MNKKQVKKQAVQVRLIHSSGKRVVVSGVSEKNAMAHIPKKLREEFLRV